MSIKREPKREEVKKREQREIEKEEKERSSNNSITAGCRLQTDGGRLKRILCDG